MINAKIVFNLDAGNPNNIYIIESTPEDVVMEYATELLLENSNFFSAAVFNLDSGLLMYEIWD